MSNSKRSARTATLTAAALLSLSVPWVAVNAAYGAPGDVTLQGVMPDGSPPNPAYGVFAHDISGSGDAVLFQALEVGRIFYGLYVRENGVTTRVDVNVSGSVPGNPTFIGTPALSDDASYVAFKTTNAYFGGDDGRVSLVLKNRQTGAVAAVTDGGTPADQCTVNDRVEVADAGAAIAFTTAAALEAGDTNGLCDVYLWDATTGVERVSPGATSAGDLGAELGSQFMAMSPNGRWVLYKSDMDTATPNLTNINGDLWLYDRTAGTRTLQSAFPDGSALPDGAFWADVSDDGDRVVYQSSSDPTGEMVGIAWFGSYLNDRVAGTITDITASRMFAQATYPSISGDGTHVAADIGWVYLTTGIGDNWSNVGVYDIASATWQLASHTYGDSDTIADTQSRGIVLAADASRAVFTSSSTDLLATPYSGSYNNAYTYEVTGLMPPDADADGILDSVDADGGDGSLPGQFYDVTGSGIDTFGRITSTPVGMTVSVTDLGDPDGVRITTGPGAGFLRYTLCGYPFTISMPGSSSALYTCGSIRTTVESGGPVVADLGDGTTVTMPSGTEVRIADGPTSGYTVQVLAAESGQTATISKDGLTAEVPVGSPPVPLQAWTFTGFSAPIDNGGVVNIAKAGEVIPVRWKLTSGGVPVTTLTSATISFTVAPCTTARTDKIEDDADRASGLRNLGGGRYGINWKSPKLAGKCGVMSLDIGDGVLHTARFKLR